MGVVYDRNMPVRKYIFEVWQNRLFYFGVVIGRLGL